MTTLIAPDDRQFQNGPRFAKGDAVDVAALAEAIGHADAEALAADLIDQGWATKAASKPGKKATKKAAAKTDPAPAGDDTAPEGADTEES